MSKLTAFKKYIEGKHIAVVGIGVSNTPLIDFLLSCKGKITARDIKTYDKLSPLAENLEKKGVKLILGENYLENFTEDIIFKAPGIRGDLPQFKKAISNGIILTSEMEVFIELCPCKIFGITGSDGKTTTTTLTYKMLELEMKKQASDARVWVGGNIGKPLLPEIEQFRKDDFAVVELSSFQLQDAKNSPFLSAITNISPNHLNWHIGMDEYILAKKNIFGKNSVGAVLNYDCEISRNIGKHLSLPVTYFSGSQIPDCNTPAVYEDNGKIIYRNSDGNTEEIVSISDIKLPGRHNVENYMTAIALTKNYVSRETVEEIAKSFGGVEHRCEFVREYNGVKYYNSSIDSSPTRTEAALRAFKQKSIVILGGYDKNIPYEPLAKPLCECTKVVVLVGDTSTKIKSALLSYEAYKGEPKIFDTPKSETWFEDAVKLAKSVAKSGDIVILSPASASFDMFKNFEERGNIFKNIVNNF